LRALQGIARATALGSREAKAQARAHEQAQREAIRQSQQRSREEKRAGAESARTAQEVAQTKARAEKQAGAEQDRQAQRTRDANGRFVRGARDAASARIAEEARVSRAVQKEAEKQAKSRQEAFKRAGGVLTGVAGGVVAGSLAAASTARGATGAKSLADRIQAANEFRTRLVTTSSAAGLTDVEREAVQQKIVSASTKTGTDANDLLGVIEQGQAKFNSLKFFADNLEEIATIAKASGSSTEDLAVALGTMRQQFKLTPEQTMEAAYLIKSSADKGSIELKNFAKDFAGTIGIFANNTGQTGIEGVRQFIGASQTIATGGFDSVSSSTKLERIAADLQDADVRSGLKGIGVKESSYIGGDGKVDLGKLITQLSGNKKFQSGAVRQDIFKEVLSRQGIEAMISAKRNTAAGQAGAFDFETIARGADAASGRSGVGAAYAALSKEGAFRADLKNADMQADTLLNLESFNSGLDLVTSAANTLEKKFGSLSLWWGSIAATGAGVATTMAGQKLLGGGAAEAAGGAGAGAAGGGALASLGKVLTAGGTAVGGAGALAIGGAVGLGGALGYGASLAGDAVTSHYRDDKKGMGDAVGSWLFDTFNGGGQAREKIGGQIVTKLDPEGNALQKEVVQVLKQIDSGLRAAQEKPQAGGAREPR
jgi:hypothetical protein